MMLLYVCYMLTNTAFLLSLFFVYRESIFHYLQYIEVYHGNGLVSSLHIGRLKDPLIWDVLL